MGLLSMLVDVGVLYINIQPQMNTTKPSLSHRGPLVHYMGVQEVSGTWQVKGVQKGGRWQGKPPNTD